MSQWGELKERVAGKWQVPLLVVSLLLLSGAVFRIRPSPTRMPLDEAVERLDTLVSGGLYEQANEFGFALLARTDLTDADRAPIHLHLARAGYGKAESQHVRTAQVGRQIVEHYQRAASHGQELTALDHKTMGLAFEWRGEFSHALEHYEYALDQGIERPLDLRKRVLAFRFHQVETPPGDLLHLLDDFIADAGDRRLDLTLWAIERKLEVLESSGRLADAATCLARNRDRFHASDLRDRFAYLEAWLLYKQGHFDEAETYLRTIRNQIKREDEAYAMTGWLLGRVAMTDDGPQRPLEALSFFTDVIRFHPGGRYAVASRVGSAEALAMLERQDEAIEAYHIAIEELETLEDRYLVNRQVLRTSLGVMADAQRRAAHMREAVAYAKLATALIDTENTEQATSFLQQLAQLQSLYAAKLEGDVARDHSSSDWMVEAGPEAAREVFSEAASTYMQVAQLNALNEGLAVDALWRAAELLARAGKRDRAARLYRAFAAERPQHTLIPQALLRIGRLRQLSGMLPEAIEAFRECCQRFPRTLAGSRALVPLAQCYLALGPDYQDLAEKTLRVVIEDSEVFTPQAPGFADALFLYGDALNRRGEFERAIAVLEEVLERYPDDPRVVRARYLLADSYRKSGLALKGEVAEATSPGEIEQMRAEYTTRFHAARRLFRQLIMDYQLRDPATLNRLERMYLRHAYLYEADCLFEVQDYRRALGLYEEATGMYKDTSSALAAYVQIINGHVFLGEPEAAQAALARALVLVGAMPEEAFADSVSPEMREDWKRYFEWLGESELF